MTYYTPDVPGLCDFCVSELLNIIPALFNSLCFFFLLIKNLDSEELGVDVDR